MGTRDINTENTRQLILAAAERVFLAKGFAGAALGEVADAAGVTKSLIQYHFESKEGLWTAVCARRSQAFLQALGRFTRAEAPTLAQVRQDLDAYFRYLQSNPEVTRLLLWSDLDRASVAPGVDFMALQAAYFARAQTAGVMRADVPSEFLAMQLAGLVEFWFQARHRLTAASQATPAALTALDERYAALVPSLFLEGAISP